MKNISSIKSLFLLSLLVLASLTGCINETLDECPSPPPPAEGFALRIKVVNAKGDDITALGEVKHSTIFVFDEKANILEKRRVDELSIINRDEINLNNYPAGKKIYIVAWGNLSETNQILNVVNNVNDLDIYLKEKRKGIAQEPDRLFFGLVEEVITAEVGIAGQDQELVLAPKTGTIKIETRGLINAVPDENLRAETSDSQFDFYMSETKSGFDNKGNLIGDNLRHNPDGHLLIKEWVTTHDYNVFPGDGVRVSIDMNQKELGGITEALNIDTGEYGKISTTAGKRTYVIIYFGEDGSVSAKMKITDWGVVDDNIEF